MMVPNDRALGRSIVEGHMEARFPFPNFELSSDLTQGDWVDIIASALGRPSVAFPIKFEDERTPPIDFVLRRGEETTLVLQQHEVDDEGGGEVVLGSLDAIRGLATLLNGILQDPTGAPGMDIADLRVHSTNTTIGPVT